MSDDDVEPAPPAEALLLPALAALDSGDIPAAVAAAEDAVAALPDLAAAHHLLGSLAYGALDDYPRARRHFEESYRLSRHASDLRAAARTAIALATLDATSNNMPGMRGWLSRTRRLIDEIGPCPEEGYYHVAMVGCDVPDVTELEASAARALELAREFSDAALEVRALADSGLALISLGRTAEGLARIDEALTAVLAGEVRDLGTMGLTCCAVVTACERLGDMDRLTNVIEALRRMSTERFRGFSPPILTTHCHQTYGGMLCEAGLWQEAEVELHRAVEASQCAGHRAAAMARLAELRIDQNRVDEAAELLRGWEDRLEAAGALARLHDARGELDLAASTLRWTLRERETDLASSAPLLAQLVDVELRRGRTQAAEEAASRLEQLAETLASAETRALALVCRGRVQTAAGGDAEAALVAALRQLGSGKRPRLRGEIHLALAEAERDRNAAAAITEARAALAIFERLGARRQVDRAAALLRSLGVSVRQSEAAGAPDALSRREREVVPLLAEGLSNGEIAARLFITPKTVEHHVTSILGKLGLRSRAEVAAWAAVRRTRSPANAGLGTAGGSGRERGLPLA